MALRRKPNITRWRRATGMWPAKGPSGEPVLAGGGYLLCPNDQPADPGQPPYVLYERKVTMPSRQLRLPF